MTALFSSPLEILSWYRCVCRAMPRIEKDS